MARSLNNPRAFQIFPLTYKRHFNQFKILHSHFHGKSLVNWSRLIYHFRTGAGGKPSTWFPPGRLVEHTRSKQKTQRAHPKRNNKQSYKQVKCEHTPCVVRCVWRVDLSVVCCVSCVVCCDWCVVRCVLCVGCCVLCVVCCVLCVMCSVLCLVCCVLRVLRVLRGGWWVLCGGCCLCCE